MAQLSLPELFQMAKYNEQIAKKKNKTGLKRIQRELRKLHSEIETNTAITMDIYNEKYKERINNLIDDMQKYII